MSRLNLVATALALAAAALGGAAYQKAGHVETDVHAFQASRSDPDEGSIETLEQEVGKLTSRVAVLEARARIVAVSSLPTPVEPTAPPSADSAEPGEKPGRSRSPYDVGPIPKDPGQREARKKLVTDAVSTHWKAWGAKHGLTDRQSAELSTMETEAATRRLDNQAKRADGQITATEARASGQTAADDIRKKAQSLLSPEQFAQFQADKGAEWGASYRKIREAEAKEASGAGN